jgi:hypothetical protein
MSAYAEGKLNTELAQNGLVSESENPYPIGSIECREYERGVRDARPKEGTRRMVVNVTMWQGV